MDCYSSQYQKSRSPANSISYASTSRTSRSTPTRQLENSGIQHFIALAKSEKPYISPYSHHQDRQYQQPSGALRGYQQRLASANPLFQTSSAKASMSTSSSFSRASSTYDSPGPRLYQIATKSMMSNPKMSSVSHIFHLSVSLLSHFCHLTKMSAA